MGYKTIEITTDAAAGGAGVATASGTARVPAIGRLISVDLKVTADVAPATQDVTLKEIKLNDVDDVTLMVLTNDNTDARHYPRVPVEDTVGTALTYNATEPVSEPQSLLGGELELSLAQTDDDVVMKAICLIEV